MRIICYHSGDDAIMRPRPFLHVGSLAQAQMRGGRQLHRISIEPGIRIPRLRDHGDWNTRTLERYARRARVAVYLNRHEGIPLDEFDQARARCNINAMSDSAFRRAIPSATDSWIIFDPGAIAQIDSIEWP